MNRSLVCFLLVLLSACTTEEVAPTSPAEQPLFPETNVGARTGACLLNDSLWVAGSPVLVYPVSAELTDGPAIFSLELQRYDPSRPVSDRIALYATGVVGVGTYPLSYVTYPQGNYPGLYYYNIFTGCENESYAPGTGVLEITYFNSQNGIIAGRFHGTVPGNCGDVVLRKGQFDTTYTATAY